MNLPAEVAASAPAPPPSPTPPPPTAAAPRATVLVQVPISHYIDRFQRLHHRDPSPEDLRPYAAKTEASIRATVEQAIPAEFASILKVDRIDDPGPERPSVAPADAESRRDRAWWPIAALAASAAAATFAAVTTRRLLGRRPAVEAAAPSRPSAFEVGDSAGPAERVRELVRLDPSAASGVLQRWIGRGGTVG